MYHLGVASTLQCLPCEKIKSTVRIYKDRQLAGHKDRVFDVSWSPTHEHGLASVGQTGGFIWSAAEDVRPIPLFGIEVMRVCWHLDGSKVITGDAQGQISVCAAKDGAVAATLQAGGDGDEKDEVYGLQMLSVDGLLAAGAGSQVQQWDLNRGACVARTTFATTEGGFIFGGPNRNPEGKAFVFSLVARGRALCAALSDGTVRLLDSQTLQTVGLLSEHSKRGAPIFGVALSPRSPLLATSDAQGAVLLWDLRQTGHGPIAETYHDGAVHALEFVAGIGGSAELLATGGADRRLCVHETRTEALATEGSVSLASALLCVKVAVDAPSPRLATAGGSGGLISDASISLWHLEAANPSGNAPGEAGEGGKRPHVTADGSVAAVEKKPRPSTERRATEDDSAVVVRTEDAGPESTGTSMANGRAPPAAVAAALATVSTNDLRAELRRREEAARVAAAQDFVANPPRQEQSSEHLRAESPL